MKNLYIEEFLFPPKLKVKIIYLILLYINSAVYYLKQKRGKIVYFISSAKRRIVTQERVVIRTIFFVRCVPKISRVGVVLRAGS